MKVILPTNISYKQNNILLPQYWIDPNVPHVNQKMDIGKNHNFNSIVNNYTYTHTLITKEQPMFRPDTEYAFIWPVHGLYSS